MRSSRHLILLLIFFLGTACNDQHQKVDAVALSKSRQGISVKEDRLLKEKKEQIDTAAYIKMANDFKQWVDVQKLTIKKEDDIEGSAEGGEVTIFKLGSDTLRLKGIYYRETGKAEYNFYLKNKQLLVHTRKTTNYEAPISIEKVKIKNVISEKYILKEGVIISAFNNDKQISSLNLKQKSSEIMELYQSTRSVGHDNL